VIERCDNHDHAAQRLLVWTQRLRNLSLQDELGAYIGAETGQGWCVKFAPRQPADAAGSAGQSHHPDAAGAVERTGSNHDRSR
jgi:hypothetical protein